MVRDGDVPIKIEWRVGTKNRASPQLFAFDTNEERYRRIPITEDSELDAEISTQRRCIGYYDGPKEYTVCPEQQELDSGSQCTRCEQRDFFRPFVQGATNFSASDAEFFTSEFIVYLALFGEAVKVGITHTDRYPLRCIDQGADACTVVCEARDARAALDIESEIDSNTSISDRMFAGRKVEALSEPVDRLRIDKAKSEIRRRTGVDPANCELQRLTGYYLGADDLDARYDLVRSSGTLTINESIEAVKGQFLFTNANRVFNVSSLCGRIVKRRQQTGLDAFG